MKQFFAQTSLSKKILVSLSLLSVSLLPLQSSFAKDTKADSKLVRLATTTSTENSGLLGSLLPEFEKDTGYKVHTIAVGTGKALRMGRDGDVDVILVHALKAEEKFIAEGHGDERFDVMYNDFVIVGPKEDAAKVAGTKTIAAALDNIYATKSKFVSRGDDSGTHKKELGLWKSASNQPDPKKDQWYLEAGQGMGKVLQMAGELGGYTMTDRGTWLAYESKSPLKITFEGDKQLFNPYGIIAVSPKKYPDLNNAGAKSLIKWMTSNKGQTMIGDFKVSGKVLFTPSAKTKETSEKEPAKEAASK